MATFKINGKNFATQDGTGAATIHSDVVFPAGHVIQVKTGSNSTEAYSESTGFVSCSLTCTITPTSASSKIFIICNTSGYSNSGSSQVAYYTIYRDSTDLGHSIHMGYANIYQGSGSGHDCYKFQHLWRNCPNDYRRHKSKHLTF